MGSNNEPKFLNMMKGLLSSTEPKAIKLTRDLWLKYQPATGDGQHVLTAARKGIHPHGGPKQSMNFPSKTEENIVLTNLFKALYALGREIGGLPITVPEQVSHDGKSYWYAVQWKWRELKQAALPLGLGGNAGSNYRGQD